MRKFRLSKRKISYLLTLTIFLSAFINQLFKSTPSKNISGIPTPSASISAELVKVVRAVDGDTIKLETGQTVRYIGIDAPELHHPKKRLQCFGKEASDKNKELVEGKLVRLEKDDKNKELVEGKLVRLEKDVSETDRYWRLLRYVYLPTTASPSGEFINDILVREGYAFALTFPPDIKYSDHFRNLENQARENNRGLWNKCK